VREAQAGGDRKEERHMSVRIRCPNPLCPQPDDVQKVSAVYESGTDGFSQTSLSGKLNPPERPGAPVEEQDGCAPAFWLLLFFGGGLGSLVLAGYYYSSNPMSDKFALNVAIALGLGVLLMIVGVEVLAAARRGATAANAKFVREGATWQAALARWDELYYCNRCGSVFNPAEADRFVPASRMKELLV
jgi:hypothetical protein